MPTDPNEQDETGQPHQGLAVCLKPETYTAERAQEFLAEAALPPSLVRALGRTHA